MDNTNPRKLVFIFANCQGKALVDLLPLAGNFDIHHKSNYECIWHTSLTQEIEQLLNTCDYFIYQPLSTKYPIYNTANLKKYLKPTCKAISFPYIYNDALTPVAKLLKRDVPVNGEYQEDGDNEYYHNVTPIIKLKKEGKSINDIRELYFSNKIDFNYEQRFDESIQRLKQHELYTDVKVSDFIIAYHKKQILFLYNGAGHQYTFFNHPANPLMVHYVNQVIHLMGYTSIDYNGPEIIQNDYKYISLSELEHYKYEYVTSPTPSHDNYIFNIITEIYNKF